MNVATWPSLTLVLIGISVGIGLISNFGASTEVLTPYLISSSPGIGLEEVRAGEFWRLVTPIFVHFGPIHLLFNMLWLWDLGGAVELRQGTLRLGVLVLVIGVSANLAQFFASGPGFGGMSGVVYGLLSYVWAQGRYQPMAGLYLHRHIVVMMLAWYVLCWTGLFGPIANIAHTVGLVLGAGGGYAAAWFARRR